MLSKDEIIEIQYEIAVAIGSSLSMKSMLRNCLPVIQKRLSSPVGGVLRIKQLTLKEFDVSSVLSIPFRISGIKGLSETLDNVISNIGKSGHIHERQTITIEPDGIIQLHPLPDFGLLYIYSKSHVLNQDAERVLSSHLLKKLANACRACDQNDELKQTLHNLKFAQSQLIHSEKMASLGILTAGVAHELNNPLNYILGGYIAIKEHLNQDNISKNEIKEYLNWIKSGSDRATYIVKSLNLFSSSSQEMYDKCDLHLIIEDCLLMLKNKCGEKIKISKDFTTSSVTVSGNNGKLHQVILSLLFNAIEAIDKTGKIDIRTTTKDEEIMISIEDNGCGIPEENLNKVLDPFFTTKPPGEGAGLGLSITNSIIQEHNGTFLFTSEVNKGTTVRIYLPK